MAIRPRKRFAIILILIMAISSLSLMMMVEPTWAQTIPKPAVPQFSIQYVDYSYDIPAYNSTDPFTGQQIQHPSQHIEDIRVNARIKNQPFTPYNLPNPPNGANSGQVGFFYNVRYKGHFGNDWSEIYGYHNAYFINQNYSSQFTSFTIQHWQEFPEGDQIDYQVKAMIGFEGTTFVGPYPQPFIIGEESEWSSTLTLLFTKNETAAISFASNINDTSYPVLPTPSPYPTPTATVPEFPSLTVLTFLSAVFLAATAIVMRKRRLNP